MQQEDIDLSNVVNTLPLDRGEKHAIQLAQPMNADCVLLDDQLARESAQHLGLRVEGTLGVIVDAYRRQKLRRVELDVVFEALLARQDIWISDALVRRVKDELIRTPQE